VSHDRETRARHAMVAEQIRRRGIRDRRVLAALAAVPRHPFVPPSLHAAAHDDAPLPIGHGQTISQPYMVALMTAAIAPRRHHRVLEIGTGSGYQAAVLAHIVRRVFTVERLEALSAAAAERLARLGYHNVEFRVGDGSQGWPDAAPFDGILVTAAAPDIPGPLLDQLAVGGRIAVPVGDLGLQLLTIAERRSAGVHRWTEGACRFVPLIGPHGFPEVP
jgi:protein-L-isoaspartate(D-aspartate) O-methyltransferase